MAVESVQRAMSSFEYDLAPLSLETLQLNITRLCNQACSHCHVGASPGRTETMSDAVMDRCVEIVAEHQCITTVDITGGAPELHPRFESLVERVRALGRRVLVRHNLTVTIDPHPLTGRSMSHLPRFFARNGVEVIASLPCYTQENTDGQRGAGVFEKSIAALRMLNAEGYGRTGSHLVLNLVSNPLDAYLPPAQCALEADFRRELGDGHGVEFSSLYTITNMPIERFGEKLDVGRAADAYMELLAENSNTAAAEAIMCRSMVSVAHDGTLYDCDFNQMLDMAIGGVEPLSVFGFDERALLTREIRFAEHCLGCTAGQGSSCGGATV
ncbi:MAG: Putative Fe-S oxidoreductase [Actinobacteria bacterium 66_15]|nr:MAG: Putative Fe-S oxidoreductase [Actinobacteria bacterium 66_15]